MAKYRKKHTYDCVRFNGSPQSEIDAAALLEGCARITVEQKDDHSILVQARPDHEPVIAEPGDWLVKDAYNSVSVLKPDVFAANFEQCRGRSRG